MSTFGTPGNNLFYIFPSIMGPSIRQVSLIRIAWPYLVLLLKERKININATDDMGNMPLHLAFAYGTNDGTGIIMPPLGSRTSHELALDRLECAKLILSTQQTSKKPMLLTHNLKDKSPYICALERFEFSIEQLKEPKKELTEEFHIKKSKVSNVGIFVESNRKILRRWAKWWIY